MTTLKIVHLVDDTTAGGVMRMVDYLVSHAMIGEGTDQTVRPVKRSLSGLGRIDADVIVSHLTISWRGLPGLIALRAMNPAARLVHVEHSYTRAFTALNVSHKSRFFALLRVAYSLFDRLVAVSHAQASWLRERKLVERTALDVIHPMVDLSPFERLSPASGTPRVIGAIGRLERQKGFDILIEAFRLRPQLDVRLKIFGEGSERAHLEALAAGDSRIEFCDHAQDPASAMNSVDIVAMPSRWEAYGLVALEARTAGRRLVVAAVDGLTDQITESTEVAGHCDPQAWAVALEKVVTNDASLPLPGVMNGFQARQGFACGWRAVLLGKTPVSDNDKPAFAAELAQGLRGA